MSMKASLQLRLGQTLAMTPQLQQAIRLLQLSTLELQTEIQQALDSNPMLEMEEPGHDDADGSPNADRDREAEHDRDPYGAAPDNAGETGGLNGRGEERSEADGEDSPPLAEGVQTIPDELPVDSHWDDFYDGGGYSGGSGTDEDGADLIDVRNSPTETLADHLAWQVNLLHLSDTDRAVALALVDAIDEDGYLTVPLEEIQSALTGDPDPADDNEPAIGLDEIEAVLHLIQRLDPPGVGARNLSECLAVQLEQIDRDEPALPLAMALVRDHLNALANLELAEIKRSLGADETEIREALGLIRTLRPKPGTALAGSAPQYVVPDVFVRRERDRWRVELNPEIAPRLRINALYASIVRRSDNSTDGAFLRSNLQEARWFIKSLQSRNETLLRVASAIVERQRGFLEQGEEAMQPLVLRDIAEALEMHESTVSRVTTQKYMHTPRGTFEFKYFFSSHVGTVEGGACSSTAIRAMIRKLVAAENPGKPLSDSKIAALLGDRGIRVARRTVAKYRETLAIPPSKDRKRLA